MNCQKVQSLISAYLDGELAGQEMLAIRHHLTDCTECAEEYESLLAIKRTFGKMRPMRPVDDLAARICSKLVEVHVPFHVRMTAAVRNYLQSFPAGIRVGAAGIAVIAGLLMIRGGDVPGSRLVGIPISSATLQTFAQSSPLHMNTAVEASSTSMTAAYDGEPAPWQPASTDNRFTYVSRTGSLILTEYRP